MEMSINTTGLPLCSPGMEPTPDIAAPPTTPQAGWAGARRAAQYLQGGFLHGKWASPMGLQSETWGCVVWCSCGCSNARLPHGRARADLHRGHGA
eukprot:scaffold17390_cov104-Isochrysis_galbana.AAC.11